VNKEVGDTNGKLLEVAKETTIEEITTIDFARIKSVFQEKLHVAKPTKTIACAPSPCAQKRGEKGVRH
jgi:hypothetical protein